MASIRKRRLAFDNVVFSLGGDKVKKALGELSYSSLLKTKTKTTSNPVVVKQRLVNVKGLRPLPMYNHCICLWHHVYSSVHTV